MLVADKAMFNNNNLRLMEEEGMEYVVSAKLKSLPKKTKAEILSEDFKPVQVAGESQEIKEFEHKQRRLIVSYSNKDC